MKWPSGVPLHTYIVALSVKERETNLFCYIPILQHLTITQINYTTSWFRTYLHGKILQYPNVGAPELPSNLSPIWLCPPCVFVDKHFKHWNNWNFKREAEADCCCQTQYWTPVIIRLVWLVLSALSRSQSLIFFSGREIHAWCGCLTCSAEWADWLIELLMLDLP